MKTQLKIPFNMVEIVIALVIILVALVGILGLMPRTTATSQDAISRSSAADGADQALRHLKAQVTARGKTELVKIPLEAQKYTGEDRTVQVQLTQPLVGTASTDGVGIAWDGTDYRLLKVTQRTDTNQTDFEGIMRLWRSVVTNEEKAHPERTVVEQNTVYAEVSWPANVAYDKRSKKLYSYELVNVVPGHAAVPKVPVFSVLNGEAIANTTLNVTAVSIGAAMSYSGYAMPVTCDVAVNGTYLHPFGDFEKAWTGARVDGTTRTFNIGRLNKGDKVVVKGKCWIHNGSSPWNTDAKWKAYGGNPVPPVFSSPASNQVWVVLNGEKPKDCPGYDGQTSVTEYLAKYMNPDGTIKIGPNDVMYLFEMGSTSTGDAAFDLNDMMVLISGEEVTD